MIKFIDLTDKKFGRLMVIKRAENARNGDLRWLCKCDCGNEKIIKGSHLKQGFIRSCGCLEIESRNHGANYKHGGRHTRLYSIWSGMRKRCQNPHCAAYDNYGGRGIKVCGDWDSFEPFRDWALANGYADDLSIDRINNDGNYDPFNCRWANASIQAGNRRPRKNKKRAG